MSLLYFSDRSLQWGYFNPRKYKSLNLMSRLKGFVRLDVNEQLWWQLTPFTPIASRGDVGRLVASTYNSIRSIREQWKSKASSVLKSQIRHILSSMKTRRNRGLYTEGDWGFERETMQENILSLSSHEFIEKVVCEKMLTSKSFSDWIVEEFKKL